jgi:hypothetical protein
MCKVIVAVVFLFYATAAQAQSVTEQARTLVGFLNAALGKSRFKAMKLSEETCTNICSYSLTNTSFLEVGIDSIKLIANIESSPNSDEMSEDLMAATYLYSLILWSNMPTSATYDDANKFLGGLLNSSSTEGAAVASSNNWTYGVVHIKCFGSSTMLIALKTLSASVGEVSVIPVRCKNS